MLMDEMAGANGVAMNWRVKLTMACFRVSREASGSWREVSLAVGVGALPGLGGGGMLAFGGLDMAEWGDGLMMVMVIAIEC